MMLMVSINRLVYMIGVNTKEKFNKSDDECYITIRQIAGLFGDDYDCKTTYNILWMLMNRRYQLLFNRSVMGVNRGRVKYRLSQDGRKYFENLVVKYDPYTDTYISKRALTDT